MLEKKVRESCVADFDGQMQWSVTFRIDRIEIGTVENEKFTSHKGALLREIMLIADN